MKSSPKVAGVVREVLVENAQPVEFGQSSSGWTLMPEAPQAGQATFNFKAAITQMGPAQTRRTCCSRWVGPPPSG